MVGVGSHAVSGALARPVGEMVSMYGVHSAFSRDWLGR